MRPRRKLLFSPYVLEIILKMRTLKWAGVISFPIFSLGKTKFKNENVKGSYFYFLPYISLKKKNRGSGLYFLLSYFFEKILKTVQRKKDKQNT